MRKKFLTILMSMLMVFVMMPMGTWTTYAAGGNLSQDDDGTYLIADYADLKAFAKLVNGGEQSANAKLTADITCTGKDWVPIGNNEAHYLGTFDGAGHIIKGLSNESMVNSGYQGLFGWIGNRSIVKNVGLKGGSITGKNSVGGVVGQSFGTITNCYNTGTVSGEYRVGGVTGDVQNGEVTNCYNTGAVSGTGDLSEYVGGVAGYNNDEITNCYSSGAISGTGDLSEYVGGVAGENAGTITNCYNSGAISGTGDSIGGVAGSNVNKGEIKYCYYDRTLNAGVDAVKYYGGGVDKDSVKGLTTSEMTGERANEASSMKPLFAEGNPWIMKADGKNEDTSDYYWYYPHLKGFNFDSNNQQLDSEEIAAVDWPPKATVKADWDGTGSYEYDGSAKKPEVVRVTVSKGSLEVPEGMEVKYYEKTNEGWAELTSDKLTSSGNYRMVISDGSDIISEQLFAILDPAADYTVTYYKQTDIDAETGKPIWSTESIEPIDAGNYKAAIELNGHTPIEKEFEINQAATAIETAPAASAITYGQSLADSSLSGGIAKSGDTKVEGIFTWNDNTIKPAVSDSNATEYEVTFTPSDSRNYMTATTKVKLTVNKADITPSVSIQGWSYGSAANKPEVEGNTGGGTETFLYKEKDAPDTAYSENVPTDAGTYTVKAEVAETDNYNSGSATLDFTIAPADMQVTSSGVNVDFDGSGHSITVNAPEGASVEYSQDGGKTYSTMNPVYTDAGSHTVPFTVILKNYKRYEGTEQVIIHQAPNSVSVSIEGWVYGEPAHIPSVDAKFGADHAVFSYSDAPDGTYNPGGPDQAGTWYLKATVPETTAYAGAESAPFAFEIAKAQLTITAKDQTYEYNRQEQGEGKEEDAAYTDSGVITEKVTVEGLQKNDAITSVKLTGHRKNIGEYPEEIKIADFVINDDAAAKDNYEVTLVPGKLTITKHILTETKEVPATCEKDGTKAYWTCSECNKMFSDKDGENEITEPEVIKATGHDWGEWVVTKEATETEEGSETRTCKNDPKHTETRAIPATIAYRNVSGEGNTWYKGSDYTSDFAFKRSVDDDSTISHFAGIRVDNTDVDEANYSKEPGSVIIKLKPEYLETLALGKHTLEARFDDGNGSAAAEFTIAEAEKENTDDEGDDVNGNGGSSMGSKDSKDSKKSVKTGDESLVTFWTSLLGVSMIGLIMLFAARLRLRRKDR